MLLGVPMRGRGEVSNEEWAVLEPLLHFRQRPDGRGRPPQDTRAVLNGVLWILPTGAQWRELPKKYPPYQTCHRRFQQWVRSGQLNKALRALARELHGHGLLPLEAGLLDGTFASAKCEKGGLAVGPTKRGKGTKIMAIAAVTSLPLAVTVDSASPHETKLVEETLAGSFLDELPARLIGDRAYDSDPLDRRLERDYGIELIAPNRENRSQTQDGRELRRYKRRWCVERLFAWLQWFRRLVTRYEYHIENFLGMVRLGCMRIMLRYL